jgi:hypothetical protein
MDDSREVSRSHAPERLRGPEAFRLHVALVIGLALCAGAFWFELKRALAGNALSWAYVFEWPLLAVFAVYMWSRFLHPGRENAPSKRERALDPSFEVMRERWEASREELERNRRDQGSPDA